MSGLIGLTRSGQALDSYMDKVNMDDKLKKKIVKFITNKSRILRQIHDNSEMNDSDKQTLLHDLRLSYKKELEDRFRDIDEYPLSLMRNYIVTLTKLDFTPSTKTQQNLIQKSENSNTRPMVQYFLIFMIMYCMLLNTVGYYFR